MLFRSFMVKIKYVFFFSIIFRGLDIMIDGLGKYGFFFYGYGEKKI